MVREGVFKLVGERLLWVKDLIERLFFFIEKVEVSILEGDVEGEIFDVGILMKGIK